MKYAMIFGDELTKFEPIVFVYNNGKYEVLCESAKRQQHYYTHLASRKYDNFEKFLSTFSYFNIESGEVTDDIELLLNKLRAKFGLLQLATQETEANTADRQQENPADAAILKMSRRLRTGNNEN